MSLIRHLLADIGALLRSMKTHDLNARTFELAHEKGITFADARRELARRASRTRAANRTRTDADRQRAEQARMVADRISP